MAVKETLADDDSEVLEVVVVSDGFVEPRKMPS